MEIILGWLPFRLKLYKKRIVRQIVVAKRRGEEQIGWIDACTSIVDATIGIKDSIVHYGTAGSFNVEPTITMCPRDNIGQ